MFCWGVVQPCICVTEYGEEPKLEPIPDAEMVTRAARWFAQEGIIPLCGTQKDWDLDAYPEKEEK